MAAKSAGALRVLFSVAAGPRIGYGHLVRATVLARAMGTPAMVSLRGNADACRTARRLGCRIVVGSAKSLLRAAQPDIVVIDDPSRNAASLWCRSVQSAGVPVASIHDIGIGYCGADLTIDGSVIQPAGKPPGRALLGPRYAIVAPPSRPASPSLRSSRPRSTAAEPGPGVPPQQSVLVALGGGPRDAVALALARAIRLSCPEVSVRLAAGYAPSRERPVLAGVTWLGPRRGLGDELARASVAVVGGGVTLYEACREGTPAVAVTVVPAQRPTIRAFVNAGAALDGGGVPSRGSSCGDSLAEAPRLVALLMGNPTLRRRFGMTGRSLIDGHGAQRVARALNALVRASYRSSPRGRR